MKRTVTIKGLGEQLTREDAVNAVNEQDKDINNIKENTKDKLAVHFRLIMIILIGVLGVAWASLK